MLAIPAAIYRSAQGPGPLSTPVNGGWIANLCRVIAHMLSARPSAASMRPETKLRLEWDP